MTSPVLVGPSTSNGGPTPIDLDDYLADIGDRIRAERQARGWSQGWLAQRAGISLNSLKTLEAGTVRMRPLVTASWALGVPVDHLLSDRWQLPDTGPSLTPRQAEVLQAAAGGDSLTVVAVRLGMGREAVSSHLSRAYQQLGVEGVPRGERRAAAVRVARLHGLLDAA